MPEAPKPSDKPTPPSSEEAQSSAPANPALGDWKKLDPGELPPMEGDIQPFQPDQNVDPATQIKAEVPPSEDLPTATPAVPPSPKPLPDPANLTGAQAGVERPKPKVMAFPKFSMLSKKPRELLSRKKKKGGAEEAPSTEAKSATEGETKSPDKGHLSPAPAIQKMTLDPSRMKGRAHAPAEKLPHPRELPEAPAADKVPEKTTDTEKPATPEKAAKAESPKVHHARPAWVGILLAVLLRIVIIAAIVGLGYASFYQLRETRLEGFVSLPEGYQLKKVCLVRDFRPDVFNLVEELAMTRTPLHTDIEQLEDVVSRSKADVAGREERIRLLREEIETAEKEIAGAMKDAKIAGDKIWQGPGAALDAEYNQKKEELHKRIVERATQLRLNYNENTDFKDPEVWVNAYRLSLYDVPKTVNTATEREWAEKQLADWKKYVENYQQQITDLKKQVEDIQSSPQGRITEVNRRVTDLKQRISETEVEMEPIQQELKNNQNSLAKLKDDQAGLDAPFYKQMIDAPEGAVLTRLQFDAANNRFSWRYIDKDSQYQPAEGIPGNYFLWVSATSPRGGEYWSVVPISIYRYRTSQVIIQPGALISVRKILESATAKPQ